MAQKRELPGWFPFAIVASAVVAIAAGARSGWTLSGDQPKPNPTPQPPPGPPQQASVLNGLGDWTSGQFRI